jgi:hypothetical protein
VPDANTIWTFREQLTKAGAIERLVDRFDRQPREAGYLAMSGQRVDASIIPAPKQRNTKVEKQAIKEGRVPEEWQARPAKLRQKDRDAAPGGLLTAVPSGIGSSGFCRMMDGEVHQGQAAGGWAEAGRSGDPGPRLPEPYQHRPAVSPDPTAATARRRTRRCYPSGCW